MPLVENIIVDPCKFKSMANSLSAVCHPVRAGCLIGYANHPDMIEAMSNAVRIVPDVEAGLCLGSTHEYSAVAKRVVYHCDHTAQFIDLSNLADKPDDQPGPDQNKQTSKPSATGVIMDLSSRMALEMFRTAQRH